MYKILNNFPYFILIGALLLLLNNTTSAQNWVLAGQVPNPGSQPSISVVDWNTVWIADGTVDTPKVFRTTNSGLNWTQQPAPVGSKEIYCVWGLSNTSTLAGEGVVNGNARMFITYNSGLNWSVITQTGNNRGFFNGIAFQRMGAIAQIGLALAERIYRTSDGGFNWIELQSGTNGVSNAHNSLFIVDNFFYGFGLNNGAARLRVTPDNANSWQVQQLGILGNYTSAVAFKSDKLMGVAATSSSMPYIARTTNGGLTWANVNIDTGITGETKIKWVFGTDVLYILGDNGGIKRSIDGGLTWTRMGTAGVTGLKHFDFAHLYGVIFGYAVSSDGRVIKLADSIIFTGTPKLGNSIPEEYNLEQNYPNPFNPTTTVNYDLPQAGYVKIAIYDLLGREVHILVDREQKAGKYEVKWNASDFPSGVYFYSLKAGDFSMTKKMILVK